MKITLNCFLALTLILLFSSEINAQYGYGNGYGYGNYNRGGYGRQRNTIPEAQTEPEKEKPKTADEIVDLAMPNIIEAIEINEFEAAVLSSILKKYLQQRIEMQILELSPEKMREGMEKIIKNQDDELKSGLPTEKYDAFVAMQKKGVAKTKKETKKKKKRKQKSKD